MSHVKGRLAVAPQDDMGGGGRRHRMTSKMVQSQAGWIARRSGHLT